MFFSLILYIFLSFSAPFAVILASDQMEAPQGSGAQKRPLDVEQTRAPKRQKPRVEDLPYETRAWMQPIPSGSYRHAGGLLVWGINNLDPAPLPNYLMTFDLLKIKQFADAHDKWSLARLYECNLNNLDILKRLKTFLISVQNTTLDGAEVAPCLKEIDEILSTCQTAETQLFTALSEEGFGPQSLKKCNPYVTLIDTKSLSHLGLKTIAPLRHIRTPQSLALKDLLWRNTRSSVVLFMIQKECLKAIVDADQVSGQQHTPALTYLDQKIQQITAQLSARGHIITVEPAMTIKNTRDYCLQELRLTVNNHGWYPTYSLPGDVEPFPAAISTTSFGSTNRETAPAPEDIVAGTVNVQEAQETVLVDDERNMERVRPTVSTKVPQSTPIRKTKKLNTFVATKIRALNRRPLPKLPQSRTSFGRSSQQKPVPKKKPNTNSNFPAFATLYPSVLRVLQCRDLLLQMKATAQGSQPALAIPIAQAEGDVENESLYCYVVDLPEKHTFWERYTAAEFQLAYLMLQKNVLILNNLREKISSFMQEVSIFRAPGSLKNFQSTVKKRLEIYQRLEDDLKVAYKDRIPLESEVTKLPHAPLLLLNPEISACLDNVTQSKLFRGLSDLIVDQGTFQSFSAGWKKFFINDLQARLGLLQLRQTVLRKIAEDKTLSSFQQSVLEMLPQEIETATCRLNEIFSWIPPTPQEPLSPYFKQVKLQLDQYIMSIVNGEIIDVAPAPKGAEEDTIPGEISVPLKDREPTEFTWVHGPFRTELDQKKLNERERRIARWQEKEKKSEEHNLEELRHKLTKLGYSLDAPAAALTIEQEGLESVALPCRAITSLTLKSLKSLETSWVILLYQLLDRSIEILKEYLSQGQQYAIKHLDSLRPRQDELRKLLAERHIDVQMIDLTDVVEPHLFALNLPLLQQLGSFKFARNQFNDINLKPVNRQNLILDLRLRLDFECIRKQIYTYFYLNKLRVGQELINFLSLLLPKTISHMRASLAALGMSDSTSADDRPYSYRHEFEVVYGPYVLPFRDGRLVEDRVRKIIVQQNQDGTIIDKDLQNHIKSTQLANKENEQIELFCYICVLQGREIFYQTLPDEKLCSVYGVILRNEHIFRETQKKMQNLLHNKKSQNVLVDLAKYQSRVVKQTIYWKDLLKKCLTKRLLEARQENNVNRAEALEKNIRWAESTAQNIHLNVAMMLDIPTYEHLKIGKKYVHDVFDYTDMATHKLKVLNASVHLDQLLVTLQAAKYWHQQHPLDGSYKSSLTQLPRDICRAKNKLKKLGVTDIDAQMAHRPYLFRDVDFQIPGHLFPFRDGKLGEVEKNSQLKQYDVRFVGRPVSAAATTDLSPEALALAQMIENMNEEAATHLSGEELDLARMIENMNGEAATTTDLSGEELDLAQMIENMNEEAATHLSPEVYRNPGKEEETTNQ